jgi:cation diffusion facilitator CzcD-associated flavoprotein CzcO
VQISVVGTGIAALNALVVASGYLQKGQRVVLVERRPRCGGMWNDAYPFVRLHQPHGMFTAGSIKWQAGRPPSHLAARHEVLDHFATGRPIGCFDLGPLAMSRPVLGS